MKRGVPCADLIDFTYGYNNVFWHTPQDTVDKLSPQEPADCGECDARDGAHPRQDGSAPAEVRAINHKGHEGTRRKQRIPSCTFVAFVVAALLRFFRISFLMHSNMRTAKALFFVCIVSLACFAANPPADNNDVNQVIQTALQPSPLQDNLRRLTDEIGGRVPGTPAMQHAVQWGMQAFTAAGADSVHTEGFEIPYSWAEGATEMTATTAHQVSATGVGGGTVLSPFRVRAVSVAWAPALAPVKHVPIIDVGEGTDADFQKAGDISGKILLVHTVVLKTWDDLFAEYANAPPIIDRAVKAKAKAIAFMATREHDILYRHTNSGAGEIDRLPMVIVAREDGERMARLLAAGNLVWADLSIPNQIGGPIKTSNVIAEIRGSEKPDEFVILGAHLDSWELGTGALDNGCNAALVIDALRAIKASGLTPRRTIRFILFSGKKQGLLGSRAYASQSSRRTRQGGWSRDLRFRYGKTTGFSAGGRNDVLPIAKTLIAPLAQFDVKD